MGLSAQPTLATHNNSKPYRCPAVKGKSRCQLHGGAKGSGAPRRNINSLKHGTTTAKSKAFRKNIKLVIQQHKSLINGLKI